MRDLMRRLEDLEAGRARQRQLDAQQAEPIGCPEGLSPGEAVEWWVRLPSGQKAVELRAMNNERFSGFIDALAERFPEHAARFNRGQQGAVGSSAFH